MKKVSMFNKTDIKRNIGEDIKFRKRLDVFKPVEHHFKHLCDKFDIDHAYDVGADENTYFDTINYTTYAGLFIMHPLTKSTQIFQMWDAKSDQLPSEGHVEWIAENIKNDHVSKYTLPGNREMEVGEFHEFDTVAILPGSNKFEQHVSFKKFKHIIKKHGVKIVLKPHPITNKEILGEIFDNKGHAQIAGRHDNMYSLIDRAKTVYTTHISETALTALLMGKEISPLEPFGARLVGSFCHINLFCFSDPDPINTIKSIFASHKSGVLHPEIDSDWKCKMEQYFEYILNIRSIQHEHYLE